MGFMKLYNLFTSRIIKRLKKKNKKNKKNKNKKKNKKKTKLWIIYNRLTYHFNIEI